MIGVDSIQKFIASLMHKPQTYYRWYKINKSRQHLCDIIMGTQSHEEHHLIVDNDFNVYCFRFGQRYTSFEKLQLPPYTQLKKFIFSLKTEQNHLIKNADSSNSILKRIIFLKSELKNHIDSEDYRKCQQLHNFIMKYQ